MEGKVFHHVLLFLFYVFLIPDTNFAENLYYQENQVVFPSTTTIVQKDIGPLVNPTGPLPPTTTTTGGSWCIANPAASPTALQVALDYACGFGGADCSATQPNGSCFDPNTMADHASYAFNDYYQKNPIPTSCVFGGTAQLTNTDPSHGSCRYASPTSTATPTPPTPMIPTPMVPTPTFQTPLSPTMPATNPYTPGGAGYGSEPTDNDYGAEPTGMPNSVETISSDLVLLITMSCLMMSLFMVNHV